MSGIQWRGGEAQPAGEGSEGLGLQKIEGFHSWLWWGPLVVWQPILLIQMRPAIPGLSEELLFHILTPLPSGAGWVQLQEGTVAARIPSSSTPLPEATWKCVSGMIFDGHHNRGY